MKTRKKIAIIGPYPPPFGGISVHVQRIMQYLPADGVDLYNSSKNPHSGSHHFYGKIKYLQVLLFLFKPYRVIHTHTTDNALRILFGLIGIFRKNIYLHLQGASMHDFLARKNPASRLMKRLIRKLHILAANADILEEMKTYGPRSICEIDAFLPPPFNQALFDRVMAPYLYFFAPGRFIISMTGWFDTYRGVDLYGFDIALQLVKRMKEDGNPVYLAASVNGTRNEILYEEFISSMEHWGLRDFVLLIHENLEEAWPLFMASDVFIRPSISDGSALSVKEAQWMGTPVIASDCVPRPDGVVLFRNRQVDDLYEKMYYFYHRGKVGLEEKKRVNQEKKFTNRLITEVYGL